MRCVIVGGVAAGMSAASKIRREEPFMEIAVYQEEGEVSYAGCGLPYYLGGEIEDRSRLVVRTADTFRNKHQIYPYLKHKVTRLIPSLKKIEGINLVTGRPFIDRYDKLLIATGASPVTLSVPGVESVNVFQLRSVFDADRIKDYMDNHTVKQAVIIGDGFIAMEMAEAFYHLSIPCTIISNGETVMRTFDSEMSAHIERHLREKGISVVHNFRVKEFSVSGNGLATAALAEGQLPVQGDLFLLAIGIRPNVGLAAEAGIKIGETGAIWVNQRMETSVPDVYAAGDCVETTHLVTGRQVWIPLGSTANKQGRVAGTNMCGKQAVFRGVTGSSITKIIDIVAAKTGISAAEAERLNIPSESVSFDDISGAGYYPASKKMYVKVLFHRDSREILGAQAVGGNGVDKRMDIFATAIFNRMKIDDLFDLDLCYAPPFSKPLDAVHVAGMLAGRE